jgi:hypothetical protein
MSHRRRNRIIRGRTHRDSGHVDNAGNLGDTRKANVSKNGVRARMGLGQFVIGKKMRLDDFSYRSSANLRIDVAKK